MAVQSLLKTLYVLPPVGLEDHVLKNIISFMDMDTIDVMVVEFPGLSRLYMILSEIYSKILTGSRATRLSRTTMLREVTQENVEPLGNLLQEITGSTDQQTAVIWRPWE